MSRELRMGMSIALLCLATSGCSEDRTPRDIAGVEAASPASTEISFTIGVCHGDTKITVKETATEIQLTAVASSDTDDKCADFGSATLASPIGDRTILDTTSGLVLTPDFAQP